MISLQDSVSNFVGCGVRMKKSSLTGDSISMPKPTSLAVKAF
jgi:hypothetical protein